MPSTAENCRYDQKFIDYLYNDGYIDKMRYRAYTIASEDMAFNRECCIQMILAKYSDHFEDLEVNGQDYSDESDCKTSISRMNLWKNQKTPWNGISIQTKNKKHLRVVFYDTYHKKMRFWAIWNLPKGTVHIKVDKKGKFTYGKFGVELDSLQDLANFKFAHLKGEHK